VLIGKSSRLNGSYAFSPFELVRCHSGAERLIAQLMDCQRDVIEIALQAIMGTHLGVPDITELEEEHASACAQRDKPDRRRGERSLASKILPSIRWFFAQ
jgi:hypothetical protein